MGCHPSHWWTPSFFKMVKATNQHWMRTISPISDDFQSSTCCFFLSNRQEASHVAHASVTEVVDHAEIWRHGPQRIRKNSKVINKQLSTLVRNHSYLFVLMCDWLLW
jgi:hypothetical protein